MTLLLLFNQGGPPKLQLSLLENAYDSLNASLEQVGRAKTNQRRWKLAIFLLVHSLELLLKERLLREHRLLVFSNVDKPSHTVSMELALTRLQALGVAINPADEAVIRRAIGWRDRIAHYEFDVLVKEAEDTFSLLFEFAHSFHGRELDSDLHLHIEEANWRTEAALMEVFRQDFITYNGVAVPSGWPAEIVAAQSLVHLEVGATSRPRIPYGPQRWPDGTVTNPSQPCHDCSVLPGQLHVLGCDAELCPRCGGQLISCGCAKSEEEWASESFVAESTRVHLSVE